MGLFFDDEPKSAVVHPTETRKEPSGFISVAGIMILGFFLAVLGWIFKPLFTWAFTFEGRSRDQVILQIAVIVFLFGGTAFMLYKIPPVRDFVSLSPTHTINIISNQGRILFPDRSLFALEGQSRELRYNELGNIVYFTYSGYNEHVADKMENDMCQLVPRSEKKLLSSDFPPVRAEGFEDEVKYAAEVDGTKFPFYMYTLLVIAHPSLLFNQNDFKNYRAVVKKETKWSEFLHNWDSLSTITGTQSKWFEVKALSTEHAIICF